jgi:subtilisin family serine protease
MDSRWWHIALVGLVIVAVLGVGFGATAAVADDTANETGTVAHQNPASVTIADELQNENGEVQVLLTFEDIDNPESVDELQAHAAETQSDFDLFAQQTQGVTIENEFWITSAVVATVDTDTVDLESLASVDSVTRLLPLFEVSTAGDTVTQSPAQSGVSVSQPPSHAGLSLGQSDEVNTSNTHTTYGLDQIDAPEVWNDYNTKGEGVRVAVLDTGVDPSHQDIDLYTDDDSDPQYPGGWAEFDDQGNRVNSEPKDFGSHGTHVSGTVTGGDASGEHIGVAPNAELMHSAVLTDCSGKCQGTGSQIIAGMEWAINNDADIISMSLGGSGYLDFFIEPVQNARSAGIPVVAAAGNGGEGTSISPGNVYDSISVGASDSTEDIAVFSGGETIVTDDAWNPQDSSLISEWPDEYTVPDIVAPGASIKSSVPGDGYSTYQGTSMATPHVSGALALIQSATDTEYSPAELEEALYESASKPDDVNEPDDERDTRYGLGIINVPDAIEYLEGNQGQPDISVTDASLGESTISAGDSVGIDATLENTGDAEGDFTAELEVDGSVVDSQTVTISAGNTQTVTFQRTFGQSGDYTISVNGVDAGTLTVSAEPDIQVTGATLNETTIFEGEGVAIDATLENSGGASGDFTAELEVEGAVVDSQTVTVGAGNTKTVTFEQTYDQAGTYNISVNGVDTNMLTVEEPTEFTIDSVSLNKETANVSEVVTVTATVANIGNNDGTFTGDLTVDGTEVASNDTLIEAGTTETVTFEQTFSQPGQYALAVNGEQAPTLTIQERETSIDAEFSVSPTKPANGTQVQITGTFTSPEANIEGIAGGSSDLENMAVESTTPESDNFAWNLVSWSEAQSEITLVWTGTVPQDASEGDILSLTPTISVTNSDNVALTGTLEVGNESSAVSYYADENGNIGNNEIFTAVQDWQNGEGYFAGLSDDEANQAIFELVQIWQSQKSE